MSKGYSGLSSRGGSSGMSTIEREAVEWYVSGEGMWINQALREREGLSASNLNTEEKKLLNALDEATTKDNISQQTLYRSVDAEAIFGKISTAEYENMQNILAYGDSLGKGAYAEAIRSKTNSIIQKADGKTITEKGFMSTTTSKSLASEWGGFTGSSKPIVMEISVKGKTKGIDLTKHRMGQNEVLLARNTEYKIKKIFGKNGQIYVKAEI